MAFITDIESLLLPSHFAARSLARLVFAFIFISSRTDDCKDLFVVSISTLHCSIFVKARRNPSESKPNESKRDAKKEVDTLAVYPKGKRPGSRTDTHNFERDFDCYSSDMRCEALDLSLIRPFFCLGVVLIEISNSPEYAQQ